MYTSHGHHINGTILDKKRPEKVARCGGPGLCIRCSQEAAVVFTPNSRSGPNMEFNTFVRKPFTVEAIEVTNENIRELAELIGEFREKDNGMPYIQVDRRLVPNIYRVYPGFWVTKMGDNVRCYSKRIFIEQFTESTPAIDEWVKFINGETMADVGV